MSWLRPPSLLSRITRMIKEREHSLLDAQMQVEAATSYADQLAAQIIILQDRARSLREEMGVDKLDSTGHN